METEKAKTTCEAEHQVKAAEYTAIQKRLAYLLNDIPRTINRAKYVSIPAAAFIDALVLINLHVNFALKACFCILYNVTLTSLFI